MDYGHFRSQVRSLLILEHTLSVRAIDQAGNQSTAVNSSLAVIAQPVIISPPVSIPEPTIAPVPVLVIPPSAEALQEVTRAVELPGLAVPIVTAAAIANQGGDTFSFSGISIPNARVAVYIHSTQALLYQTRTDNQGVWKLDHSQQNVELTEGNHSIYAIALDPNASVKSRPSEIRLFTVKKNVFAQMFGYLNLHTTLVTFGILIVSAFWLFFLKKKGVEQV